MSSHSVKKIKIVLEYSNKTVNEEVDQYRPIKFLKERAMKIFFPLNFEIKLFYMNKELTSYESILLGEFFKNKSSVCIKVVQEIKKKSSANITSLNYNPNQHRMNNALDDYNSNRHDFNTEIKQPANKTNNIQNNLNSVATLCECGNDNINFFCRNCDLFLCKNCRVDYRHNTHRSLHVDVNHPEESVKLYAITLQSDISLNLKAGKIYSSNFQDKKLIDIESRKEIVVRKLDEIERRLNTRMRNNPSVDAQDINNILVNLDNRGNIANKELEDILDFIYKNYFISHKKLPLEEMNKLFQHINLKEKEIEDLSNTINSYKMNYDIHIKIDNMYKTIEQAIDNILLSELDEANAEESIIITHKVKSIKKSEGDMSSEKKSIKKEQITIAVRNAGIEKKEIVNKEHKHPLNIKFKRTVIEAVNRDMPSFIRQDYSNNHTDIIPLGIDMEYNSQIEYQTKKRDNIDVIDNNFNLNENSRDTAKKEYMRKYISSNNTINSDGD